MRPPQTVKAQFVDFHVQFYCITMTTMENLNRITERISTLEEIETTLTINITSHRTDLAAS